MKPKHANTLKAIFIRPTLSSIGFSDIEAMEKSIGGQVREGEGSRVTMQIGDSVKNAHRPHPGKEAKRYQVEEIRAWLKQQGVTP
jgi:HicA toxin of bacterial toxin-antitoxin,